MTGSPSPGTEEAALGLAYLSQSGCRSLLALLGREDAVSVWSASRRRLLGWGLVPQVVRRFEERRRSLPVGDLRAALERSGVRFVPHGSSYYPAELLQLRYPPAGLFVRGSEDALTRVLSLPRVTIVGTRKATPYGLRATDAFSSAFAGAGVVVVSGLALGIDGRAHTAALDAGGLTVAVLGCGVDVAYPRRHQALQRAMAAKGVLLSELPPGTAPARWTFPQRNRLLAALGDAVLITEGSVTSGALQTADWALELGRPVFVVPGPIGSAGHAGCNRLLYEGAGPAVDPFVTVEDFLIQTRIEREEHRAARIVCGSDGNGGRAGVRSPRVAGVETAGRIGGPVDLVQGTGSSAELILEVLERGASSVDGLVGHTGLPARKVAAVLAALELMGLVVRNGTGLFIRAP